MLQVSDKIGWKVELEICQLIFHVWGPIISLGMIEASPAVIYMMVGIGHWQAPTLVLVPIFETRTCIFHPLDSFSSTRPKS